MSYNAVLSQCPSCGETWHYYFARKNEHTIYKCIRCKILSVHPLPTGVADEVYNGDYFSGGGHGFGYVDYDKDKEPMREVFNRYLVIIENHAEKKGTLLDVGAATGFFLDLAREKGWTVSGVEISDYAAAVARKKGLNVETGTLEDHKALSAYDVVTMLDVLEHFPHPEESMKKVNTLLAKNGVVIINTPDSGSLYARLLGKRWHLIIPPEHIHYFNKKSVEKMLAANGFEVVSHIRIGKKFTLEYIFLMLAKWTKLRLFYSIVNFLKNHKKLGQLSLPINFNDNMFVVARKIV